MKKIPRPLFSPSRTRNLSFFCILIVGQTLMCKARRQHRAERAGGLQAMSPGLRHTSEAGTPRATCWRGWEARRLWGGRPRGTQEQSETDLEVVTPRRTRPTLQRTQNPNVKGIEIQKKQRGTGDPAPSQTSCMNHSSAVHCL